jgi:ferric-dicitrate binding protein FerR (iron transport regulator)
MNLKHEAAAEHEDRRRQRQGVASVPFDPIDSASRPRPIPERPARRELRWWQAVLIIIVSLGIAAWAAWHLLDTLDKLARAGVI